jgi:5-methylcytosine-specific restriction endonuclease McrA
MRKGSMWFTRVNGRYVLTGTPPPSTHVKTRREQARAAITTQARTRIKIEADGTCTYCRRQGDFWVDPDGMPWHMDHVIPIEQGGSLGLENVALACRACNMAKGPRTPEQWRANA